MIDWLIDYAPLGFWPAIVFGAGYLTGMILRELRWTYEELPKPKEYNAMIWVSLIMELLSLLLQWLLNKPNLTPEQKQRLGAMRNRFSKVDQACEAQGIPMLPDGEADAVIAKMHGD